MSSHNAYARSLGALLLVVVLGLDAQAVAQTGDNVKIKLQNTSTGTYSVAFSTNAFRRTFALETSTNLKDWNAISTNALLGSLTLDLPANPSPTLFVWAEEVWPGAPFPGSGPLYAFGDSETSGVNGSYKPYTSGGFLLPQYRWVDMLASSLNLDVYNYAVGGTKISWQYNENPSHFNMTGNLDWNWGGVAVAMNGWNNLSSVTTNDSFFTVMQHAHEAFIAKLLLDDYAGVSFVGWGHNGSAGGNSLYGWVTTGANDNSTLVSPGNGRNVMPFYYGDSSGARYRTALSGTQYLSFRLKNKRAIALFFETAPDGGPFTVTVNGNSVVTNTSLYVNVGGNDYGAYPGVIWIENPPADATVRLNANVGSGHCNFLAFGWVDLNSVALAQRLVVYGTTTGNHANGRSDEILDRARQATQKAVAAFSDYPVYYSDDVASWIESTDQEPADISHLTPVGNQHVAASFQSAKKTSPGSSPNFIRLNP